MAGFPDEDESSEPLLHHSLLKSSYSSKIPTERNGTCYMSINYNKLQDKVLSEKSIILNNGLIDG